MQFNYSTPVKDCQSSCKQSKSHNQTRQGDWLCLNCNNVNFSFRKKCNRCKTQTRKQNQELQNAYTLYFYNQHEANLYNYENRQLYSQAINTNEPMYYPTEAKHETSRKSSSSDTNEYQLALNANNQPQTNQLIQINVTSPFKEITNESHEIPTFDNMNKKLRTPSSKKKRTLKKKTDLLPSVSPLLKKLLAKQDTNTKDPLNVALFYDEIWDNTKENFPISENQEPTHKKHLYFTNSAKKLTNSRMHNTNDSLDNDVEEDGFAFMMQSPEKEDDGDEIIEIDEEDEELAQIISKIIV